jgi:hypothetical protein
MVLLDDRFFQKNSNRWQLYLNQAFKNHTSQAGNFGLDTTGGEK